MKNTTDSLRTVAWCIQPEDQTEEIRMLYAFSALAASAMTTAVERIAGGRE